MQYKQDGKFNGSLYGACDWLYKIVSLNFTMLIFTVMGLGLFGFFPSVFAGISLIRQWKKSENPPLFNYFWKEYKKYFLIGNLLAITILILGFLAFFNFSIIMLNKSQIIVFLGYLFCFFLGLIIICLGVYFPFMFIYYEQMNYKRAISLSVFFGLGKPLTTFPILFLLAGNIFFSLLMPQLMIFCVFSLPIFLIYLLVNSSFLSLRKKYEIKSDENDD